MQYKLEINGRVRTVAVRPAGSRFVATLDGRDWDVDVARIDAHTLSLILADVGPSQDGSAAWEVGSPFRRTVEVRVAPGPSTGFRTVCVGTTPVVVVVNGTRRRRADDAHGRTGPQRIVAPMPGKIIRVAVKPGEVVHARQRLVVVEAMKMENELRASRDGTVTELHAREGASVEAGALLVVIQ